MNKFLKILIILGFFSTIVLSQQIYFCQSYSEDGEPIGTSNKWQINPKGGYVYILYENKKKNLGNGTYYLVIDKETDGEFEAFDSKSIKLNEEKDWLVYNYVFKEAGTYKIYFLTPGKKRLAEKTVEISLQEEFLSENVIPERNVKQSSYYEDIKMYFCEWVLNERPMNAKQATRLSQKDGWIFLYINLNSPLNTKKLVVEVWRKKFSSLTHDEYIETKEFAITPEWTYSFFRYQFTEPGDYKFNIYTDKDILIGSRYIKVSK